MINGFLFGAIFAWAGGFEASIKPLYTHFMWKLMAFFVYRSHTHTKRYNELVEFDKFEFLQW